MSENMVRIEWQRGLLAGGIMGDGSERWRQAENVRGVSKAS